MPLSSFPLKFLSPHGVLSTCQNPGRLGRNGSIWGRGIHSNPTGAKLKKEGDGRSPAGVFRIGGAWGYAPTAKKHPETAYTQIPPRHLWVEDSSSPHYNRQIILDRNPSSSWEKKQQMRQGDYAHSLKIFIAHNAFPSPVPNAGSAIFFHIWRGGGSKSTAGCTTMAEPQLRTLLANLNPKARPLYVLLPKAEYQKLRQSWKLP